MTMASPDSSGGGPFRTAFEQYWNAGWRGVLPISGKFPPVTGYTGGEQEDPSFADCYAWSESKGDFNIGLRLPANVIGIDVDAYGGKVGAQTFSQCSTLWGAPPATWVSTNRNDGVSGIRFYLVPPGLSWPGQLPGGGVDIIVRTHRYAMVWPSLHPEGRVYRWVSPEGVDTIGSVPAPSVFPVLPADWLLGLVRGQRDADPRAQTDDAWAWVRALRGAGDAMCRTMGFSVEAACQELAGASSRHDTFNTNLLNLVRLGEQGHPGVVRAVEQLAQQFVQQVTSGDTHRRSEATARGEVARSLQGAVERVRGLPTFPAMDMDPCTGWVTPPTTGTPATGAPGPPAEGDPEVLRRLHQLQVDRAAKVLLHDSDHPSVLVEPVGLGDYLAQPGGDEVERISKLLPAGSRCVLAAAMKAGKTTFVVNLVKSLVDGDPFLGSFRVERVGRLGWVDFEMNTNTLRSWITQAGINSRDRVWLTPMIGKVHEFDIRVPRIFDHWVKLCTGTDVLIIDCLKPILDVLGLDENHDTGQFTTPLTRLKEEAGIGELVLVHHMGHAGERSRGDSALRGWPEVEWQLLRALEEGETEARPDAQRFFRAYGRDVDVPESHLRYLETSRSLLLAGGNRKQTMEDLRRDRQEEEVLAIVRDQPGIHTEGVRLQMGKGKRKGDESKVLGILEQKKLIFKQLDGRAHRWFVSPVSPRISPHIPGGISPTPLGEGVSPGAWNDHIPPGPPDD